MSQLRERYRKIIFATVPLGAASISALLGSAAPSHANPMTYFGSQGVAEHLAAIREAVSASLVLVAEHPGPRKPRGWKKVWGNW